MLSRCTRTPHLSRFSLSSLSLSLPSLSHLHSRSFHATTPSCFDDPIRMPNDGTTKRGRRLLEIAHSQQSSITTLERDISFAKPLTSQDVKLLNESIVDKVNRITRENQIPPQYWKMGGTHASPTSSTASSTTSPSSPATALSAARSTLAATVAQINSTPTPRDPFLDDEAEFSVDEEGDSGDISPSTDGLNQDTSVSTQIVRVPKIDAWGRAYGSGGRKTATSRVWIKPGTGEFTVNYRPHTEYFHNKSHRFAMFYPFLLTNTTGQFDVFATCRGGGLTGQAEAIRHGVAKALQNYDPKYRPVLKKAHLLTRDNRQVERKKPGRYKARKGYTFVKR